MYICTHVYIYTDIYTHIHIYRLHSASEPSHFVMYSDTLHRMYSDTPRRMQTPLCTCTLCLYNKYQRMLNGT